MVVDMAKVVGPSDSRTQFFNSYTTTLQKTLKLKQIEIKKISTKSKINTK
jgi:hypothetical protein